MVLNIYYLFYWISLSHRNWWKRSYSQRSYFWGETTKITRKKILGCKFIRINTSKEGYDPDYSQTFINKFKDRQPKKLSKKLRELEEKIEKLTGQITQ